jgi:hypothetical protein
MSYLYLKGEHHHPFWSEVQLVGTCRQFVHIRPLHVQSRSPWKIDGAWHRNGFLKIDDIPYPKKPGNEHKLYFNQTLRKAYDFDTMKSMLAHNKPLKKIDWYNTSFRTLAPAKFSPNNVLDVSPPDRPIKREIPAETPLICETHVPYVSFEICDTKMLVNTSSDEDINSIKKGVKFGVDFNSISPPNRYFSSF